MSILGQFNKEKAIELLLYVTRRCSDMYTALKVIYFADKDHLSKYGRSISCDRYVAMRHGPVPSGLYDMIKDVRDNHIEPTAFRIENGNKIYPLREPELDLLSETDIEILDESMEQYGSMSFSKLKRQSHDAAHKAADQNDFIPAEAFIKSVPGGDDLLLQLASD